MVDQDFIKFQNEPTMHNRNLIFNKYIKLIHYCAKKFTTNNLEYDDIYQIACIGLIKAIDRYNPNKNVKFVTYAYSIINFEIKNFLYKNNFMKIPRSFYSQCNRTSNINKRTQAINNILNIKSLDDNIYENKCSIIDSLGKEDIFLEKVININFLEDIINKLEPKEREFILMRYFQNKNQMEIAEEFHVSQMQISRLEKKILDKFRKCI